MRKVIFLLAILIPEEAISAEICNESKNSVALAMARIRDDGGVLSWGWRMIEPLECFDIEYPYIYVTAAFEENILELIKGTDIVACVRHPFGFWIYNTKGMHCNLDGHRLVGFKKIAGRDKIVIKKNDFSRVEKKSIKTDIKIDLCGYCLRMPAVKRSFYQAKNYCIKALRSAGIKYHSIQSLINGTEVEKCFKECGCKKRSKKICKASFMCEYEEVITF